MSEVAPSIYRDLLLKKPFVTILFTSMLYACVVADRYNRNECDLCAMFSLRIHESNIERTRTVLVFLHVTYANCVKSFAHEFLNGTSIISDFYSFAANLSETSMNSFV